ncbi:MAG: glycosyltransferase family 2 protein [Candidatus Omnitrophica bacterium]|nr:glycosyltransferase family 2 protein [Candidatus Omnitrophota bacterium]
MDIEKKMDLSIIIPAYNEEKRLGTTLERIYTYFQNTGLIFEIIVVDDGSKDGTVNLVKNFSIDHPEVKLRCHLKNKGKGAAVKTGVLSAEGDIILFTDADLSTPIEEFEKLKKAIDDGYDIAIGSRGVVGAKVKVKQNFIRRLIGMIGCYIIKMMVVNRFADTQCGFKMFKNPCGKKLFKEQMITGFAFDVEVLYKAVKNGYRIKEIPVEWLNSSESKVSVIKDPLKFLKDLMRIRMGF